MLGAASEQKDGPDQSLLPPDLSAPHVRAKGDDVLPARAALERAGWKLVRHCPAGDRWHYASDHLRGTAVYGDPSGGDHPDAPQWSVRFSEDDFDEFLFATGDGSKWIVLPKKEVEVTPAFLLSKRPRRRDEPEDATQPCLVSSSSANTSSYVVGLLHRPDHACEPWVALTDHEAAKSNEGAGFLYGGGDFRLTLSSSGGNSGSSSPKAAPAVSAVGTAIEDCCMYPDHAKAGDNTVGYENSVVPQEYGLANVKFCGGANVYIRKEEKVCGSRGKRGGDVLTENHRIYRLLCLLLASFPFFF